MQSKTRFRLLHTGKPKNFAVTHTEEKDEKLKFSCTYGLPALDISMAIIRTDSVAVFKNSSSWHTIQINSLEPCDMLKKDHCISFLLGQGKN